MKTPGLKICLASALLAVVLFAGTIVANALSDSDAAGTPPRGCTFDNYDSVYADDPACVEEDSDPTKRIVKGIGNFCAIEASPAITIIYTQGKPGDVVIEGSEDFVKAIRLRKSGNTLFIGLQSGNHSLRGRAVITCSSTTLNSIDISASTRFRAEKGLDIAESLEIEASSASSVSISNVKCRNLKIDGSTSAHIKIGGIKTETLNLDLSSAALFSANTLYCSRLATMDLLSSSHTDIGSLNCVRLLFDGSSAAKAEIGTLTADNTRVECSSGARFNVTEKMQAKEGGDTKLTTSSGASIHVERLNTSDALIYGSSGGNITVMDFNARRLTIDASISNITIKGKVDMVDLTTGRNTRLNLSNLTAKEAYIDARRKSSVNIKASNFNYK